MREADGDLVERLAREWAGLSLRDDEIAALVEALAVLRRGLDAMVSDELRNEEPPLSFRADCPPR